MLEICGLTKYYRNTPAVNDVSFAVKPGEVAVLVTFAVGEVQQRLLAAWDVRSFELDPRDMPGSMAGFLESLR